MKYNNIKPKGRPKNEMAQESIATDPVMYDMVCRRLSYEQRGGCEPSAPISPKDKQEFVIPTTSLAWLCVCLTRLEELGHSIETFYALPQGIDIRGIHNIPFARRQTLGNDGSMWGSTWSAVLPDSLSG